MFGWRWSRVFYLASIATECVGWSANKTHDAVCAFQSSDILWDKYILRFHLADASQSLTPIDGRIDWQGQTKMDGKRRSRRGHKDICVSRCCVLIASIWILIELRLSYGLLSSCWVKEWIFRGWESCQKLPSSLSDLFKSATFVSNRAFER